MPERSKAYLDGYRAYQKWQQGDIDRPVNPYISDDLEPNSQSVDWDQGWLDASFEE